MKAKRHLLSATVFVGASMLFWACQPRLVSQPKNTPLSESKVFPDGTSARPLPARTVARGHVMMDVPDTAKNPYPITKELLARGREQFDIYCAVCHGRSGNGEGMVVQRGFTQPPSYHNDRLRNAPDGHFYNVITKGWGAMYSYSDRVEPKDRWAIVAYIRALQLSQYAPVGMLSPQDLKNLQRGGAHEGK